MSTVRACNKRARSKVLTETMELNSKEKADLTYATYIQKLYFNNLQTERKQKMIAEWQIYFKNMKVETQKLENELKSVSWWLREVGILQECTAKNETTEKIFSEVADDIYQLQSMLRTVNQGMKLNIGQVPLSVLRVTDTSRDKFVSIVHELSKIRNEIISITKPSEESFKDVAQYLEMLATSIPQLRLLLKECCDVLPSVSNDIIRALSLQTCVNCKVQCDS